MLCRARKILIIEDDRDTLAARLNELGSNVVLLNKDIREKLRGMLKEFPDLALTMSLGGALGSAACFDTFTAFDTLSLGDSFDSGGDFSGFSDGDLRGGGAVVIGDGQEHLKSIVAMGLMSVGAILAYFRSRGPTADRWGIGPWDRSRR